MECDKSACVFLRDSQQISKPVSFKPLNLGIAAFKMLSGDGANYKLNGTMNMDTRFGKMKLPYERVGKTLFGK